MPDLTPRSINHPSAKVRAADAIADLILSGKTDLHGQPLLWHARRVHARLLTMKTPAMKTGAQGLDLTTVDMQCAALLHDCIEDCNPEKRQELKSAIAFLLGYPILESVEELTRDKTTSYEYYINWIVSSGVPQDIYLKLADLEDNLDPSRGPIPDSLKSRYEWARHTLRSAVGLE